MEITKGALIPITEIIKVFILQEMVPKEMKMDFIELLVELMMS